MSSWKDKGKGRGSYSKLPNEEQRLQQENDRMVSNLATKISTLKNIAIDIDKEAKYQNSYVGGMGDDFDSASGFLGSSMNRLSGMIASSSSNRKMMCYIIAVLVLVFFICYYAIGRYRK